MKARWFLIVALVAAVVGLGSPAWAQEAENPLAPFQRLMGGQWHLDGSYQEFEWGVGKLSVRARSYLIVDGEARLVSEGSWYWHPGEKAIKGVFTAVEMPVVFFDYTARFEEDRMVNDLRTYDANADETVFLETWDFTDDTHFEWRLLLETPEGTQEVMAGTYVKRE